MKIFAKLFDVSHHLRQVGGVMNATQLPALTGSEKQIAWANQIRSKWLSNITELCDFRTINRQLVEEGHTSQTILAAGITTPEALRAIVDEIIKEVMAGASAAEWIQRDQNGECCVAMWQRLLKKHIPLN